MGKRYTYLDYLMSFANENSQKLIFQLISELQRYYEMKDWEEKTNFQSILFKEFYLNSTVSSYEEISSYIGMDESTVKRYLKRTDNLVKEIIKEDERYKGVA